MSEPLVVRRAAYELDDPWAVPNGCHRVWLSRATDGETPRLATALAAYFDDEFATFVFSGADAGIVATRYEHDAPLYEEDVVELFLAPRSAGEYFEIEVNPLGTTFDARITSPDGVRATMVTELGWTCEQLFAAVRRTPVRLEVVARVPFASLGRATPVRGEMWRANFFRIDRGPALPSEFLAWRPTMRTPADFHVTAAFGQLRFD